MHCVKLNAVISGLLYKQCGCSQILYLGFDVVNGKLWRHQIGSTENLHRSRRLKSGIIPAGTSRNLRKNTCTVRMTGVKQFMRSKHKSCGILHGIKVAADRVYMHICIHAGNKDQTYTAFGTLNEMIGIVFSHFCAVMHSTGHEHRGHAVTVFHGQFANLDGAEQICIFHYAFASVFLALPFCPSFESSRIMAYSITAPRA